MNYQKHYERLIERAKHRVLNGYVELHHVLPKCLGGSNLPENLVYLTPEEHFVAHQLLFKIYPGVKGLIYGAHRMTQSSKNHKSRNNKMYGWLKKRFSQERRLAKLGKPLSQEIRAKMSATRTGVKKSTEHKAKIGIANSLALRGNKLSEETKLKLSKAAKRQWARARGI